MALTSIIASKEGGYQPLLLATFTFQDGSTLRASTHNLNVGEGGNQYGGNDYLARLDSQDIAQVQARSEAGVDRISEVTLHLYNADQTILLNYEMAAGKGFKGAIVNLVLVLMDIDPGTGLYVFSNDSPAPKKFTGICDAPTDTPAGGQFLAIRATTSHNLARVDFPILHVQQRCIDMFPRNAAERLAGGTDMSSWQWNCGYNPDQAGTDPELGTDCRRGNTTTAFATDPQGEIIADAAGVYISCNWTKQNCIARGMYSKDSSNRPTGRFTAEQWAPSSASREGHSVKYGGGTVIVSSTRNDSIYNRSYPMQYGTQWVKQPIVANILGDANSTRFEVIVCVGDIGTASVWTVLVNGVVVPPIESATDKKLHRWNFPDGVTLTSAHTGSRNGLATADLGYDSQGDPHGSLACLEVVVYSQLAQSNTAPDVRVLFNGPKVKTPNTANPADQATWPYVVTTLPPWILLDLLIWGNYAYTDIDLQSFIDAANYAGVPISYIDPFGNTKTHNRFICQFCLEDRRKGNEVVQAILRGFNAQLIPNSDTGLLQLFIRRTLADQQPAPISGSNYNTAIDSLHADNTTGSGYVAYLIDESVIQQDGKGVPRMRGPYALPSAQCPNRVSFPFQDSENVYADDSISVVDPDDVARAGGYQAGGAQIEAGFSWLGITNFDQGIRQANVVLAESLRGNGIGDTRGTYFWEPETTSRVEHLRVGHILLFRYQAMALRPAVQLQSPHGTPIMGVLLRVEAIKPATNYERVTLTLRWHEDIWYTDLYGQESAQLYSDPLTNLPARPPYPWKPYGQQPIAGDPLYAASEWGFAISQGYSPAGDGGAIAQLTISGCPPVNKLTSGVTQIQPPFMPMQAGTANTGGSIPGGTRVLMALCVQDSAGSWSRLSKFTQVDIPVGTNTNTAVTPTINWPASVAAWVLFAGTDDHETLCAQASGVGTTPATITITALNVATYGPPDSLADAILVEVKLELHGGVFGAPCSAIGAGTISFTAPFPTHQFQQVDATHGYVLTVLGNLNGSTAPVPIADFHVTDNTLGVFTVTPDPVAAGIVAGMVFEMRAFTTIFSATTIGDPNFENIYSLEAADAISGATNASPIVIAAAVSYPTGRRIAIGGVLGNTAANGIWTVTNIDATHFSLNGSTGSGAYTSGGVAAETGLFPGAEVGNRVRIIRGTGRGQERTITANTSTTLTVDPPWDTIPDNTSRFIVEEAAWQDQPPAKQSCSALTQSPVPNVAVVNINNYLQQTVLVRALIVDPNGKTSIRRWAPIREIYVWGGAGSTQALSTHTIMTADAAVLSPGVPADGQLWVARVDQDATGGWAVTWGTGTDVLLGPQIDASVNSDPLTMCMVTFSGLGGKWYVSGHPLLGVLIP